MHNAAALRDIHERAHRNLKALLEHCLEFSLAEIDRKLVGFGDATLRLQLHHLIGAEKYWIGVLEGRIDAEDDSPDYPSIASLEQYRARVFEATESYLGGASEAELNGARPMKTWGGKEYELIPAQVFMRTLTHLYHHQGQVLVMCRLLGRPCEGLNYPIT